MTNNKCNRCGGPFVGNPLIHNDLTCPSCERLISVTYWYPPLQHLNFPMPKTAILYSDVNFEAVSWGERPPGFDAFLVELWLALDKVGYPAFLRSGNTSNKHDWKESCFISSREEAAHNLEKHVYKICELSALATIDRFMPCDFWVVREIIPTKPYLHYFPGQMPITKERRYFVRDGKIECHHSYWPRDVFPDIDDKTIGDLNDLSPEDEAMLNGMALFVSRHFQGSWSCDFLKDVNGKWWLTDMAIGERSFHMPHA